MRLFILYGILCVFPLVSFAQNYNELDTEGKRHGKWQKKFEYSNQLRYEGTFDHGKEVGAFKFYKPGGDSIPTAIKVFSKDNTIAQVTYYTSKGIVISKGAMEGKERIGEWKYYHKDGKQVMMIEHYQAGNLQGAQITYFSNGQIAEKMNYENGLKEGRRLMYLETGKLIKDIMYVKDLQHGDAKYYEKDGTLKIEGAYRKNRKDGIWKYYEGGKLKEEIIFPVSGRKRK